jgi:myxalamid-type polyketide synthase MxaE and MxaD
VLVLHHRQVPPNLHFQGLNPHIELAGTRFALATELQLMVAGGDHCRAGVSSFGFGGTNAHLILAEVPEQPQPVPAESDDRPYLLAISARSRPALQELAQRYQHLLASPQPPAAGALCAAAGLRRSHHDQRLAVIGRSSQELAEHLQLLCAEGDHPNAVTVPEPLPECRPAFVFSGQGAQWPGMATDLLHEPVFAQALERCEQELSHHLPWSVRELLADPAAAARIEQTEVAQPLLFALQVTLAAQWRHWGVEPEAVVGHSMGEVAAAHVAGMLSLEDAAAVIVARGRLMQRASGQGAMVMVQLGAEEVAAELGDEVEIAAVNSPQSVVLSGAPEAVAAVVARLQERGVTCRAFAGDYAFHSRQMEPCRIELERLLAGRRGQPGALPLVSTVTGKPHPGYQLDAAYWSRNVRQPVRFSAAIESLVGIGCRVFIEIGPHPVLSHAISQCLVAAGERGAVVAGLRRNQPARTTMLRALGSLYAHGQEIAWDHLFAEGA